MEPSYLALALSGELARRLGHDLFRPAACPSGPLPFGRRCLRGL